MVNDDASSHARIEHTREAKEYYIYPTRRSVRIDEGDWKRWVRAIKNVPKREALFRDIGFTSLGISIPSFISAFASTSSTNPLPNWQLLVALISLVIAIICFLFDWKMGRIALGSVAEILQDMNEVRQRSVRSEETALGRDQTEEVSQQKNVDTGEVVIDFAEYGTPEKKADVTQILRSKISGGKLEIKASNSFLGGDPAPSKVKELRVVYFYAGKKYSKSVPEDEMLYLP